MINIIRQGDKLIGIYTTHISFDIIMTINRSDIKQYLIAKLLNELNAENKSDLFTYNIMEVIEDTIPDLYGVNSKIIFEFIPNKELVEEIKKVTERLEIGL